MKKQPVRVDIGSCARCGKGVAYHADPAVDHPYAVPEHCAICSAHGITTPGAVHEILYDPERDGANARRVYACDSCFYKIDPRARILLRFTDPADAECAGDHHLYLCPDCGSPEIQGTAWVTLSTDELLGNDPPTDDYWCPQCEDKTHDGDKAEACSTLDGLTCDAHDHETIGDCALRFYLKPCDDDCTLGLMPGERCEECGKLATEDTDGEVVILEQPEPHS